MKATYAWRASFTNEELNRLHAEGFGTRVRDDDWRAQVERWSLGWVTARDGDRLVGFVNVAWDGGAHAFILATVAAADMQRQGIGRGLVEVARDEARAAGCEWLHVDFDEELSRFYFEACGFRSTPAGLIEL